MYINPEFIVLVKYIACIILIIGIFLAPSWLARQNDKDKYNMLFVRFASWVFGWTGIGWLLGLFWGARKDSY